MIKINPHCYYYSGEIFNVYLRFIKREGWPNNLIFTCLLLPVRSLLKLVIVACSSVEHYYNFGSNLCSSCMGFILSTFKLVFLPMFFVARKCWPWLLWLVIFFFCARPSWRWWVCVMTDVEASRCPLVAKCWTTFLAGSAHIVHEK